MLSTWFSEDRVVNTEEIHGDNFSLRGLGTGVGKRWSGNCADDGNEAQCVSERQAYLQSIPCCSFFVGQGPWRVTMLSPTGYHHGIHDMMVVQKTEAQLLCAWCAY